MDDHALYRAGGGRGLRLVPGHGGGRGHHSGDSDPARAGRPRRDPRLWPAKRPHLPGHDRRAARTPDGPLRRAKNQNGRADRPRDRDLFQGPGLLHRRRSARMPGPRQPDVAGPAAGRDRFPGREAGRAGRIYRARLSERQAGPDPGRGRGRSDRESIQKGRARRRAFAGWRFFKRSRRVKRPYPAGAGHGGGGA